MTQSPASETQPKIRPMSAYPVDRPIRFHMPDGSSFMGCIALIHGEHDEVYALAAVDPEDAPADWCRGVCWGHNSHGQPSTRPIGWS